MITLPILDQPELASAPVVTPAVPADAAAIAALLEGLAPETIPVPAPTIRRHIKRYRVIRMGEEVAATAALMPLGDERYELRSVAVDPNWGGRGLGTLLVSTLQWEATRHGRRLQCVTLNPAFFERLGFSRIPLDRIPPKPARDANPSDRPRIALEWSADDADQQGARHDSRALDHIHNIDLWLA